MISILVTAICALYASAIRTPIRLSMKESIQLIRPPSLYKRWGLELAATGCSGAFPVTCACKIPCIR
jgi:hypothetical protein